MDGNGLNGFNKDTGADAEDPLFTAFNPRLYATWYEIIGSVKPIRVAVAETEQVQKITSPEAVLVDWDPQF